MKMLNFLIPVALLAFAAGCQSHQPNTISSNAAVPSQNAPPSVVQQDQKPTAVQQFTTDKATYTVETIPSPRLTPTSREGDGTNRVYSSNIIAVFVHTNGVTVDSTNASAIPTPTENSQPQNK